MNITAQVLLEVASYLTPISHTSGRIRVRVSPKIKELTNKVDITNLDDKLSSIGGIKSVKFNKIIGSITIEYDDLVFSKEFWEDLLNGRNLQDLAKKIDEISKEVYER